MQEVSRSYDQADENARQVVRRTRNVTRRKYTPEEKVRIVIEGIRGEISVSALCRREGINPGRGGLVCLNSAARFDKWNHAAVR